MPSPYSKKQVRNAGSLLRDYKTGVKHENDELIAAMDAIDVVDWWRAQHAKPLANTNALLRYYVREVGVEPEVTQRLKRFTTIVNKLRRHPMMKLDTMEDIGGIRAVLPTQMEVDPYIRNSVLSAAGRSGARASTSPDDPRDRRMMATGPFTS